MNKSKNFIPLTKNNYLGALLFDYDGVLNIGTEILIYKIISLAHELRLPTPSADYLQSIWGMCWQKLLRKMSRDLGWTNKNYDNFMKKFRQIDPVTYNDKAPGLDEFLAQASQNYLLAIITNRLHASLEKCMELTNFDQSYFIRIQAQDDYNHHKADPRCLRAILRIFRKNDITPEKVTYFGDTVDYDYNMIVESKLPIKFKAILSGGNSLEMLLNAGIKKSDILDCVTNFKI